MDEQNNQKGVLHFSIPQNLCMLYHSLVSRKELKINKNIVFPYDAAAKVCHNLKSVKTLQARC